MVAKGGFTKGPSHKEGGIPMTVKSTGQKIEVEGGEGIINKHSMADNREYAVTGTPKQIASAINEIDGNGVRFDSGAKIKLLAKGGEIYKLDVSGKYAPNRNEYHLLANNGEGHKRIGTAKVGKNYNYPSMIEIKDISIDDDYSHPKTYTYFTKAIIDKSDNDGAVMKLECIDDSCRQDFIRMGQVCNNVENLTLK